MKKIYFLLTALIVSLSAYGSGHTVFLDYNQNNLNDYTQCNVWDDNSHGSGFQTMQTFGNLRVFCWPDYTFSHVQIRKTNNDSSILGDYYWLNDLGCIYNSNSVYENSHTNKVRIRGNDSSGSEDWTKTKIVFSWNSSKKKYVTNTVTFSQKYEFGVEVYNESEVQEAWVGYNTAFEGAKTATYSTSGNSSVSLTAGTKYHFELDFTNRQLSLVIDELPASLTMTKAEVSGTPSMSGTTINYAYNAQNFPAGTTYSVKYKVNSRSEKTLSNSSASGSFTVTEADGLQYESNTVTVTVTSSTGVSASNSTTFQIEKPTVTINPPTIKVDDYGVVTIIPASGSEDGTIYYTTDGSAPSTSSKVYSDPFEIALASTVKAITSYNGAVSAAAEQRGVTGLLETQQPESARLLADFKVSVSMNAFVLKGVTRPELKAEVTTGKNSGMNESNYAFSWAKYSDYDAFEAAKDEDPTDNETLDYYSDHAYNANGETIEAFGPNVQDNNTDSHVARNYTVSYYRVYVHANTTPNPENGAAAAALSTRGVKVLAAGDESNEIPTGTAGSTEMSDYSEARIAYTIMSDPETDLQDQGGTTGVEDVVADEIADEDAPVVWYNLQGVRVENPANGIFIRVQGRKVSKELLK